MKHKIQENNSLVAQAMMGESSSMCSENNTVTRVRKYAINYRGEIIVFIRAKSEALKSKSIYKQLFDNFKYVSEVTQMNQHKIKVVFNESEKNNKKQTSEKILREAKICASDSDRVKAIKEANALAKCPIDNCHIYIPAKYSEVQGVISWPIGQDVDDFLSSGRGKFNNPSMSELKVIETFRLKKKASDGSSNLEETSIVIVTFEGNLLPNKLALENLIIPVREYKRREMYCESCKRYGHTKKMCNNKEVETPTHLCVQCKSNNHLGGSKECPRRTILEKKRAMTLKKLRQRTYAEMLKELDPNGDAQESPATSTPSMNFPTRKEEAELKRNKKQEKVTQKQTQVQKTPKSSTQNNKYPPGFQKLSNSQAQSQNQEYDETTKSIIEGLKDIMDDLNVPTSIQQLIVTYAAPYIDKFINKSIDTIVKKFNEALGL